MGSQLKFYKGSTKITNLEKYSDFITWLKDDIRIIVQVVQGLLIHGAWLRFYGVEEKRCFYNINIEDLVKHIISLDKSFLGIPRSKENKAVVSCREFAVLFCAILRSKGIPARARCGFSTYLASEGYYEDHWICEYYENDEWIKVDPQIDSFTECSLVEWSKHDNISTTYKELISSLNPLHLSNKHFITAGEAWLKCRKEGMDANKFGIYANPEEFGLKSLYGLWFIRGNLLRDFAALNKVETVPLLNRLEANLRWESWDLLSKEDHEISESELKLLDQIALYTINPACYFNEIINLYNIHEELQVPLEILDL